MALRIRIALLLLLAATFGGRLSAQTTAPPGPSTPIGGTDHLTLRPGDAIRIIIYREPDLQGEFLVDESGAVNLPLIGEQRVAGLTIREVRQLVVQAYQVHLRNPSITVIPLRRVHVLGEVQRPGQYSLDPTVSLAGAVALAGGANSIGDLRRINIVRDGRLYRSRVGPAVTLSGADVQSGDEIYVERRSWFDRNSTFLVSALLSVTSIATSIILAFNR